MRDLLIVNARIADVVSQRLYRGWLALEGGRFVEVEAGSPPAGFAARDTLDAAGRVLQPGLIDSHMHIESSLLTPRRFAEAALPWGTTTILQDPHEIANVLGAPGIGWMIAAGRGLPLRCYAALSSCVPATSAAIETANAALGPAEIVELAAEPEVLALGEMMDYRGLVAGDADRRAMVAAGLEAGLSIEGHVPTLRGVELSRYLAHGIRSDHTLMTPEKIAEELRKGLYVMLQQKSLSREVIEALQALPDRSRVLLVTDDVMPNRLTGGHLSRIVEIAVERGWAPLDALASATLRPAVYLGLRDLGAVAPGYRADFALCAELNAFPPERVYVDGALVAERGAALPIDIGTPEAGFLHTSFAHRELPEGFFALSGAPGRSRVTARVIELNETNSFTTLGERALELEDGVPQELDDLLLAVVVARATLQGQLPQRGVVGLVAGLGLERGAFATTFAHDSHNLLVVGRSPAAMRVAAGAVLAAGGGMALESGGGDPLLLPLPLAGLLSDAPLPQVAAAFEEIESGLRRLGVRHAQPLLMLTLLPLTVSPEYKLSDLGVVDVERRRVLAPLSRG